MYIYRQQKHVNKPTHIKKYRNTHMHVYLHVYIYIYTYVVVVFISYKFFGTAL